MGLKAAGKPDFGCSWCGAVQVKAALPYPASACMRQQQAGAGYVRRDTARRLCRSGKAPALCMVWMGIREGRKGKEGMVACPLPVLLC